MGMNTVMDKTAEQQGLANVAKAKYEKEVEKVQAVTQAQKEFEVAQLTAKKEDQNRLAKIYEGQGIAEFNRLKVQAGLTPQEKMEWEYKTKVGVAAELAKAQPGAFVPSVMVAGGNGNGVNAMDAVGINMLLDVMNKMDTKK